MSITYEFAMKAGLIISVILGCWYKKYHTVCQASAGLFVRYLSESGSDLLCQVRKLVTEAIKRQ